ncbi:MAG: inositol-3-phosphate synthase [Candidatus Bathyarchaeota archaeon]|nr:inositol-3-phosphate synthase [Candidatus Bathyarchaeota archaeon]
MGKVRVAVGGVGNCCSGLVQGVQHYGSGAEPLGLIQELVGGYAVSDIEFVAAFDIDRRKVGKALSEAVFSEPNNYPRIVDLEELGVTVQKGEALDGVGEDESTIEVDSRPAADIPKVLMDSGADVFVNLVSGSSIKASRSYAGAAVEAGCAFLNATPSPVSGDEAVSKRFVEVGLPLAGDDLLDQIGATVVHIGLLEFLHGRGARIDESYQLDVGGGAESVNTLWKTRGLKRDIKTSTVSASVPYDFPLVSGSTDYVDFLGNNRDSFFWFKGRYFGGAPFSMDVRLNTVDAPNAGAILLDVIRGLKVALDRELGGPIMPLCAYGFKRPPERLSLAEGYKLFRDFVES